ncbi:MAG: hypothetical protein U0232_10050 [Thermomicrobiales bacterium]
MVLRLAQRHGAVSADEADRWSAALEEAIQQQEQPSSRTMSHFITTGRKPG